MWFSQNSGQLWNGFATAPFLHTAGKAGWPVVARLKENLPELSQAAERRFRSRPPDLAFRDGTGRVEIWDADDFDPWQSLQWETVRVIRYHQHKPSGDVVEAYWLTWLPKLGTDCAGEPLTRNDVELGCHTLVPSVGRTPSDRG